MSLLPVGESDGVSKGRSKRGRTSLGAGPPDRGDLDSTRRTTAGQTAQQRIVGRGQY